MALVSVIIPTYGRFESLRCAIDSVFKQTHDVLEVVVVDDNLKGSKESEYVRKVVDKYKEKFKITYIKTEGKQGAVFARNRGVASSKGEYVTFLDDDDLYYPQKVQEQLQHLIRFDLDLVTCDGYLFDKNRGKIVRTLKARGENLKEFILKGNTLTPMIFMRKTTFEKVGGFLETPKFQDHLFMLKVLSHQVKVGIVKRPLYQQNIHSGERISNRNDTLDGFFKKHHFENKFSHLFTKHQFILLRLRQFLEIKNYNLLWSSRKFVWILRLPVRVLLRLINERLWRQ